MGATENIPEPASAPAGTSFQRKEGEIGAAALYVRCAAPPFLISHSNQNCVPKLKWNLFLSPWP